MAREIEDEYLNILEKMVEDYEESEDVDYHEDVLGKSEPDETKSLSDDDYFNALLKNNDELEL